MVAGWLIVVTVSFFSLGSLLQGQCYFLDYWPSCNQQSASPVGQFLTVATVVALLVVSGWQIMRQFFRNELAVSGKQYAAVALCLLSATAMLPFASADMQFYFNAGSALEQGINPYVQNWVLNSYFTDSLSGVTLGVMYGPLSLLFFKAFHVLSQGSIIAFAVYWKVLMALAVSVVGWLLWRLSGGAESQLPKGTFMVFWLAQPLILWEWLGNGHFDSLWLILVLLAFLFAMKDRWVAVAACLTLGAWIKFIPIIIAPWFILWWWQGVSKKNWKMKTGELALIAVLTAVLTYLSWRGYWQGIATIKPILIQSKWAFGSIFGALYYSLKPLADALFASSSHYYLTRLVHLVVLAASAYLLWPLAVTALKVLVKKIELTSRDYLSYTFITLSVYLLVWQKSLWPWYLIWITVLGLAVYLMTRNERLKKIIMYLSLAPLTFYVPWMLLGDKVISPVFYWYIFVTIIMYPLYQLFLWRREDYKL